MKRTAVDISTGSMPVTTFRALAVPTEAELEARQRTNARRDLHPERGITASELAARLGYSRNSVLKSEKRGLGAGLDTLIAYAAACGLDLKAHVQKADPRKSDADT